MIKLSAALVSSSIGTLALLAVVTVHCGQPEVVPDAPTVEPEPEPVVVVVPVPELVSPLDDAEVSLTPTLTTSSVEVDGETITQHIEVSLNGEIVFQDVIEQGTPLTVPGLDYGNIYEWRSKAIAGDHTSAWSASWSFLTPVYVVDISTLDELCEFAASLPFNAEPSNPVPYRDAIIEASGNELVGLHLRPNGRISHDIVALNIPALGLGQPHQIADVVVASTGPNPSRGCLDQTATIESGSTFVVVN
jgi:hypothetical protein